MITQEQGQSGKEDSDNGEDTSLTIPGTPEYSERSPSLTDELSIDCSEKSVAVQKYEEEWERIYCQDDPNLGEMRRRAVIGNFRASRFRSVCWRALLGVFSCDKTKWLKELRIFRQHYQKISVGFSKNPWVNFNPNDNPLNQNAGSSWHQHFCDKELKSLIRQDVVRTFPGVDFFRKETVQNAMLNVLFVYARENPKMCYRQGMHEILAPLLFVLHCDHQALLHSKEQMTVSDSVSEILDPEFLEADAYSMFSLIMDGISCYYKVNDITPTASGYFPPNLQSPISNPEEVGKENEILLQLESIKENILLPNDKELAEHLNNLEITLPVFGIRWLRLLFGREFPLQDLLVLWDAIFAEGKDFSLVNYVVVAMLVAIRNQLLSSDYTTCLMYLMRYPGAVDITFVIEQALYFKDNQKYNRPAVANFPAGSSGLSHSRAASRHHSGSGFNKPNLLSAKHTTSLNHVEKSRQKKMNISAGSSLTDRYKKLSNMPVQWMSVKVHRSSGGVRGEGDSATAAAARTGIVEGFALNDPTVLVSELKHAQAVMSLCHLKLAQYHQILANAINCIDYPDAVQALEGISQLCTLLDTRKHRENPSDVETAYEAGEGRVEPPAASNSTSQVIPPRRTAIPPSQLSLHPVPDTVKRRELVKITAGTSHSSRILSNVQLETFKETSEIPSEKRKDFPLRDPLRQMKESSWKSESSDDRPLQIATFVKF